jgi:hypothetical protein
MNRSDEEYHEMKEFFEVIFRLYDINPNADISSFTNGHEDILTTRHKIL